MAYLCELGVGHRVYLDNQGTQTRVTLNISLPGQQQQSSSSMATGVWTTPPEAYWTGASVIFKISATQGEHFIHIQDSSISVMGEFPSLSKSQQMQMQPISTMPPEVEAQPMQPMQPMTMGEMKMSMNPMEMRMGNMEMHMKSASSETLPSSGVRRFCSQCGARVAPSDRFCSSCGQALH